MAPPPIASRGELYRSQTGFGAVLVDDPMACYVDWRDSAATARDAYSDWRDAPRSEQDGRFSVYVSALDREQAAAASYAKAVDCVSRWLVRSNWR